MKSLLIEYLESKRLTQAMIEKCNDEAELKILKSILNELNFIIKWIECGHNPTDYRGINRRQVYLVDQQTLEMAVEDNHYRKISDEEYSDYLLNDNHLSSRMLKGLSNREIETFIMMKCEGMSAGDVAELLGIKTTSVESFIERAKTKLAANLEDFEVEQLIKESRFSMKKLEAVIMLSSYDYQTDTLNFMNESSDEYRITQYYLRKLKRVEKRVYLLKRCCGKTILEISEQLKTKQETVEKNFINAHNLLSEQLGCEPIKQTRRISKTVRSA
ncbi:hypothetical protein ERX37_07705 [Macrococcus hajekii]|uniref:RNA polymerase sigma factor 70 region 4 type 2 domain-containing protein n=1 Tax=Macrococcus hajekii TaxID=198482 RepID=A0A4R6BK83_9STAP|nr:sigma factor-like helix-turn-helix DNA-binding protein [Macrococcus hajekii]TDM02077.1 hypothetical protein ERX37_07705 [Macrococcus hajekii]GGB09927.1 hypothetical protein GCM10007190_17460 [Macrococcus hajekii]